jgi:hypothetical protein
MCCRDSRSVSLRVAFRRERPKSQTIPALPSYRHDGDYEGLGEVHARLRVCISKRVDAADEEGRHDACGRDLPEHIPSHRRQVSELRFSDEKTMTRLGRA